MQTLANAQNQIPTVQWLKNTHEFFELYQVQLIDRIDGYMYEYNSNQVVETLATLLESYLTVSAYSGNQAYIKDMTGVVSVATHHMAFLSGLRYDWQLFANVPYVEPKPENEKPVYTSLNALQQHIQLLWADLEKAKYEKNREKAQRISNLIVELSKLNAEDVDSLDEARKKKWNELVDQFQANQELTVMDHQPVKPDTSETIDISINQFCKELEEAKIHQDMERINALTALIARLTEISDEPGLDTNPVHIKECAALIKQFRKDYPLMDPEPDTNSLTPLELAIEEVWGWYKDVKGRYGIQKPEVEEMLAAWISFIGNLAEYTSFTNPDDYEWQKRLEEYREQYESTR